MLANWVKQGISVGGTGNITLGAAAAGYIDLNTRYGVGPYFNYVAEDGNNRETGIGHLSAASTLVRDVVLETLSSGTYNGLNPTALNLSTSTIITAATAAQSFMGAPLAAMGVTTYSKYVGNALANAPGSALNVPANWINVNSFLLPCEGVYSGVDIEVTTAGAGNAAIGLYQCINDTTLGLVVQAPEFSCATTGIKSSSFTSNIHLPAGFYVIAINAAASINFRADTGARGIMPIEPNSGSTVQSRQNSRTYNAALPSTIDMSVANWGNFASVMPRVSLRKV